MAAITLAFSMGIAAAQLCHCYSFPALASAAALLSLSSFLALKRHRLFLSLVLGLAAVSMGGLLTALARRDVYSDSDLRHLLARREFDLNVPVSFEGCVIENSTDRGGDIVATVELNSFKKKERWIACEGKGILRVARPGDDSAEPDADLIRGDRVRGWAVWQKPNNYQNPGSADRTGQLARRGIYVIGRIKSTRLMERISGGCSDPWTKTAVAARAHVQRSLEPLANIEKGQPSAVLSSLVIGDYAGLNNATRETFQNSGTYHVLVVSGLHVAWITALLLQFFKLLRLPERVRYFMAAFAILLYTCIVGFQASITRCLWMFLLYLTARMIFRKADAVNVLLASALILLAAQPGWLYETGFQLSFLSVMAIAVTAVPAMQRYLNPLWLPLSHTGRHERLFLQHGPWHRHGRRLRTLGEISAEALADSCPHLPAGALPAIYRAAGRAGRAVTVMVLTSISVQLWLEPLLAFNFNRISWISPLANIVMVPFSSLVLAAGIAATLAALLPLAASAAVPLAGSLASLLLDLSGHITSIPGAWQRCPTPSLRWILCGVLLLFLWSFFKWRRFWIPCAYVAVLIACLAVNSVPIPANKFRWVSHALASSKGHEWEQVAKVLSFTFLDVGEGDSAVIRFPDGKIWLLDAGGLRLAPSYQENAYAFDIGEAVVSRYLWEKWVPGIDRLILSHADQDHAGGIQAVMKNFRVVKWSHSQNKKDAVLAGIMKVAGERRIPANVLRTGMVEHVGPVTIRTLHPRRDSTLASSNDKSIVLHFSYGRFSALLPGDLEKAGEQELLERHRALSSSLLKVAHHGSRSGTSNALLARARPRWAIVSAGRNNPFGHPSPEVMARLREHGVRPFLTLQDGAVTFETDGKRYVIQSHVRGILEQGVIR